MCIRKDIKIAYKLSNIVKYDILAAIWLNHILGMVFDLYETVI